MTSIENIWREFSANLKQFILKRISDESIAEDILQEVFIKIHSQIDTLEDMVGRLPEKYRQAIRKA